ncbi:hypothetical protein SynMVIR181_01214 [Synechococcus sp. MVIR-18-1]|nr:hypothetical protein SynMVIR181_01214 [Synechococcus sp. MVIR-18-1]
MARLARSGSSASPHIFLGLQITVHPLLPVDQPALTVGLLLLSGVIGLLLPHQCFWLDCPLR